MKGWHLTVLLLAALLVDHNTVHWALAVDVGGYDVVGGFVKAFRSFDATSYVCLTGLRLVPYVALGALLIILSKTNLRDYVPTVLIGGLAGILWMIILGFSAVYLPSYTNERGSSTAALALLFAPISSIVPGAIGAVVLSLVYALFRKPPSRTRYRHRRQSPAPPQGGRDQNEDREHGA